MIILSAGVPGRQTRSNRRDRGAGYEGIERGAANAFWLPKKTLMTAKY
jgi:hypothetical protein